MTETQAAMHRFYSQFCLAIPESVLVDEDSVFPYITYDYRTSETMLSQLCTFQIWDRADHITRINDIANQIEKSIPSIVGTMIKVEKDIIFEWQNPIHGNWIQFELADFSLIVKEFHSNFKGKEFTYRQMNGVQTGVLKLLRGTPFIQSMPINETEKELKRYMGNIEVKHYLL